MSSLRDNRFAVAARYNDALAEEWGAAVLQRLGVPREEVYPVAVQRALRLHFIATGRSSELRAAYDSGTLRALRVSKTDQTMIDRYAVAVLDGILIGIRARAAADESS